MVDQNLKADAQAIIAAGYNLKTVFMGPDQNISVFSKFLDGTQWQGAGVGYGIRGSKVPELTVRLEDILKVFREKAEKAEVLFNYSPNSTLWALRRRLPLPKECGPGTNLVSFPVFFFFIVCLVVVADLLIWWLPRDILKSAISAKHESWE